MLSTDGGLLRGTLDVLILKALSWGPRHGYAVAEWVSVVTDGDLLVEEGPLYTALHRLEKNGWLVRRVGILGQQPPRQVLPAQPRRPRAAARAR